MLKALLMKSVAANVFHDLIASSVLIQTYTAAVVVIEGDSAATVCCSVFLVPLCRCG